MKRLWLIIVLVAALAAVHTFGVTVYHMATGGVVERKDGVLQNSRVYFEDIRYEDGKVYYTVVNDTYRHVNTEYRPRIQRWKDGEWKVHPICADAGLEPRSGLGPFSRRTESFAVSGVSARADVVGEYRLYFGDLTGKSTCIVGYLTITEEMVKDLPLEGELFYTEDGIRQNTLLTVDAIRFVDYAVVYTVTNRTGVKQYGWYLPIIEKRVGDRWQPCQELAFESDMYWSIESGEGEEAWFHMQKLGDELIGEYRFIFGWYNMEEDYKTDVRTLTRLDRVGVDNIVVNFTVTEEMIQAAR